MWEGFRLAVNTNAVRSIKDTRKLFPSGIKYNTEPGIILRRLPHENLKSLVTLLTETAKKVGPFTLTKLPKLIQITGIAEQGIPGIDWSRYHRPGPRGYEDTLGFFVRAYFDYDNNSLDLSSVRGFDSFLEQIKQRG